MKQQVGFIANLKLPASHSIVSQALTSLGCMEHRGACSADDVSGDGSGVMTEVPWKLLAASAPEFASIKPEEAGVGMLFLPNDDAAEAEAKAILEGVVAAEGRCRVVGWRKVPVDSSIVGRLARATEPRAWQVVLEPVAGAGTLKGDELERELFLLRKLVEKAAKAKGGALAADFYVCTLSCRTITYKGMLQSSALGPYYLDLQDPRFESRFAIYHRRFSTNTTPKWPLAQPMRVLGHNGEINTLQGNLNWVASRQDSLRAPVWEGREGDLLPLCDATASDSANLDRVAELMVRSGADSRLALMALVPEAYRNHPDLVRNYPEVEAFYEYYEGLQEGWDGPALLVFSDGARVGARLDRNGLRPARWWLTKDGTVYVASEVGVLNDALTNAGNVVRKGRLGPGQMVCADLATGTFQENTEIAKAVAATAPYADWLSSSTRLEDLGASSFLEEPSLSPSDAVRLQASHGMSAEDAAMVVEAMAAQGVEPTYCMGDDIPLAVLSARPHPLADYFKQRFAQVTNPPIDPLREGLVMSLEMRLGRRGNLLQPGPDAYRQVLLKSPILLENELRAVATATGLGVETFSLHYDASSQSLEQALASLCDRAEKTVRAGKGEVLVLSDRQADPGEWDPKRPPVPALLAVGAVHHHLIKAGLRTETSIVAETAQCFSTHHAALLVGYGELLFCFLLGFFLFFFFFRARKKRGSETKRKNSKKKLEKKKNSHEKTTLSFLLPPLSNHRRPRRLPLPRLRDRPPVARLPAHRRARQGGQGPRRLGRQGPGELQKGRREGPAQDPLQDGHLAAVVLPRGADLRGVRPGPRRRRRGLQGVGLPRRGHDAGGPVPRGRGLLGEGLPGRRRRAAADQAGGLRVYPVEAERGAPRQQPGDGQAAAQGDRLVVVFFLERERKKKVFFFSFFFHRAKNKTKQNSPFFFLDLSFPLPLFSPNNNSILFSRPRRQGRRPSVRLRRLHAALCQLAPLCPPRLPRARPRRRQEPHLDRRGRARRRYHGALLHGRDVAGRDLEGDARDDRGGDEQDRRQVELGRGRGGPREVRSGRSFFFEFFPLFFSRCRERRRRRRRRRW